MVGISEYPSSPGQISIQLLKYFTTWQLSNRNWNYIASFIVE